jgi:hypothetical protein
MGRCASPSPRRWAQVPVDAPASGGHGPDTQDFIVAMVPVGFHRGHGLASAFQALGVLPSHRRPTMRTGGELLGESTAWEFMMLLLWTCPC